VAPPLLRRHYLSRTITTTETIMAKEPSSTSSATDAPTPRKSKWKVTAVLFLVVLPLTAFALWVTIALSYSYSSGERAGFVQKLSNKGWICKTWEGELALANGPQVMPEIFRFTVRDAKVAEQINNSLGKQVKLSYQQHVGIPTQCFGETQYFVEEIQVIGAPPPASGGVIAPPTMMPVDPGASTPPAIAVPPTAAPAPVVLPTAAPRASTPPAP
jgi:hypothetical protein